MGSSRDVSVDVIKWIALGSMLIDHAALILPSEIRPWLRVIGRLAFPLFCLALAANVYRYKVGNLSGTKRYLQALVFFSFLSQLPFVRYFQNGELNILVTLSLALPVAVAAHHLTKRAMFFGALSFVIAILLGDYISYGLIGVLLPAVLVRTLKASNADTKNIWAFLSCLFAILANTKLIVLFQFSQLALSSQCKLTIAGLSPLLGLYLLSKRDLLRPVPVVGSWLYAVYPLHLLLLACIGDLSRMK